METPAPRRRFDPIAYLKLFRFPLVFTAIADSATGFLIGYGSHAPVARDMGLLAVSSGGLYLFGMALNDIADRGKDLESAPGKVLPSGRVSLKGAVIAASSVLAVSLAAIVLAAGPFYMQAVAVWSFVLLCILAYDMHWIKQPPLMGLVRASNLILGIAAVRPVFINPGSPDILWMTMAFALPLFCYVTCLTYVSTLEDGPIDRRKVVIGTVGMSISVLLAAVVIPVLSVVLKANLGPLQMWPALLLAWLLVAWIARRAWRAKQRRDIMLLVRDSVAGIILVDAVLLLPSTHPGWGLAIASLLIPAILSLVVFKKLA